MVEKTENSVRDGAKFRKITVVDSQWNVPCPLEGVGGEVRGGVGNTKGLEISV